MAATETAWRFGGPGWSRPACRPRDCDAPPVQDVGPQYAQRRRLTRQRPRRDEQIRVAVAAGAPLELGVARERRDRTAEVEGEDQLRNVDGVDVDGRSADL